MVNYKKEIDTEMLLNSVLGHLPAQGWYAMYSATKHTITNLTQSLRKELCKRRSKTRVTVSTEQFTIS